VGRLAGALALVAATLLGSAAPGHAQELTIYSSLPLVGEIGTQARDVVLGERLALEQAGGRAGPFSIRYVSLNDGSRRLGAWQPELVARNARGATLDDTTIAYLGEFNSGASTFSIPMLNEAGILQVSPSNTYVGLTRSRGAFRGEPDKYYPAGTRTYGRVVPADHLQAAALARYVQVEGVKRVFLVDDNEVYGRGIADLVRPRLRARGIRLVGRRHLAPRGRNLTRIAGAVGRSSADAMLFGGITQNRAARLWQAVHRRDHALKLFGPDGVADSGFTRRLSAGAARRTYITDPTLDPAAYPASAQAFYSAFRARFGRAPEPYAIYGYETMSVVLDAIRRAGPHGNERDAVVGAYFRTRDRDSVLGRYSVDENGDTTLSTYGGLRVTRRGQLVYARTLDSSR